MRGLRVVAPGVAAALFVMGTACSNNVRPAGGPTGTTPSGVLEQPLSAEDFSQDRFSDASATIDNRWFPLVPGTQFVYEGKSGLGEERENHRVVFTVTDLTKVVDGVRNIVIWDQDFSAGKLVETELAFFAQDNSGTIWHSGQYPEEYEDGKFVAAPGWIAGIAGAKWGITMKAEPKPDAPDYSQGFAPKPINWVDRARVREEGAQTCVPAGCYEGVLITEEFELDKPASFQLKYYAAGVGNVRVGWAGANDEDHEVLELVEIVQLSPEALAEVRAAALRLEERAYDASPDVYGKTSPSEPLTL